ncbi:MAG: LysR family transcriptional regulator [Pseudomonadales bacterium]|jgi:DNA-binding transcriptional LysR family regulator|nr:LysR family transcriptional regulator [Pseudomonadales bacterium]
MDTPELAAFVAVADHGSFSLAADALHLTQSATSRRIASLERRLGVPVFDRVGRRVTLTEAGRVLLPRARRLLGDLEDTRTVLRDLSGRVAGPLALATSHHIGLRRLPPVLRHFSREHPEVELDLQFLDSEAAHELLLQGVLELAVVTLAPGGVPPLASHAVWDDPLVFAAGAEDPLLAAEAIDLATLAARPAVLPGPGTYTGRIVTAMFERAGLTLTRTLTTNYLETIQMMTRIGLGWTVLPQTMIEDGLAPLAVVDAPALQRTLGWVRHPDRTPSNAARAFVRVLEAQGDPASAPG